MPTVCSKSPVEILLKICSHDLVVGSCSGKEHFLTMTAQSMTGPCEEFDLENIQNKNIQNSQIVQATIWKIFIIRIPVFKICR